MVSTSRLDPSFSSFPSNTANFLSTLGVAVAFLVWGFVGLFVIILYSTVGGHDIHFPPFLATF